MTESALPPRYDRSFPDEGQLAPPWSSTGARVTAVHTTVTAPEGVNLVIVRVVTDRPGLSGLGCATFAYRATAVARIIDDYLGPRLVGRAVEDITDIVAGLRWGPYWRDGPIGNTAVAGIDMALWDLKARAAGVPVWSLLGGRLRTSVPAYSTAYGRNVQDLVPRLQQRIANGDSRFRVVLAEAEQPGRTAPEPDTYISSTVMVLDQLRQHVADTADFVVDVHGFLPPGKALQLAAALEPLRPLFLEDAVAVEDLAWLPELRRHTSLPLAVGELFTSVGQCLPLIADRTVDYLRCHLSAIGGFTAGVRLAAAAELFGVRCAWHGPLDLSPIGHAANLALDVASPAFGLHEHTEPSAQTAAMFPGAPQLSGGAIAVPELPGWGVEFDEQLATRFPPVAADRLSGLEGGRRPDGSLHNP